jgi:hypothetical protein
MLLTPFKCTTDTIHTDAEPLTPSPLRPAPAPALQDRAKDCDGAKVDGQAAAFLAEHVAGRLVCPDEDAPADVAH